MSNILKQLVRVFSEVKAEVFKVTWPSKQDLVGTTIIVCLLTVVFAVILGGLDAAFNFVIKNIIG